MNRHFNGCSTPAPKSSMAKQQGRVLQVYGAHPIKPIVT